ncbi:MAG: hypothetical protein IJO43_00945 [Bacilli bacterium]|nr:hypothetical protein [Bacilli bacterium]
MKKENFRYLYSFKYSSKEYIYLISKNCPFYFLEYNSSTNNFDYPDINTFKELYNRFYSNDNVSCSDIINDLKEIKKKLLNINIDVIPLIRTASGLLSLTLALSMCGCTQTSNIDNINNNESSSLIEVQDKSQEIYNYFKKYNMDVVDKEYDGNDYIFVNDFINSNNKHQITLHSYDDFRNFKNINFIPAWDDVIKAFYDNENIDNDKKNIILDGINNLRNSEELRGMDLSVLYANAQRMQFKYLSSEEMSNAVNKESAYAYFDSVSGIVYLPSDKPLEKFEFIHEVLGHGTLSYREETEDALMVFDCTNYLMLPTDNRYTGYSVGVMVSEGGANMLAHLSTNDYSVSTFYELYEEELRVIADLCNVSIGQLFNHKGVALYDLMYQNGISTPVEYIFKMDGIYKGQLYCQFSDLMERLFVDATEEKFIDSSEAEQDEIVRTTVKIIKDSHFKDRGELNFSYVGGEINYNFEESAQRYEENIAQLKAANKK